MASGGGDEDVLDTHADGYRFIGMSPEGTCP
jgi:hypothetical protein